MKTAVNHSSAWDISVKDTPGFKQIEIPLSGWTETLIRCVYAGRHLSLGEGSNRRLWLPEQVRGRKTSVQAILFKGTLACIADKDIIFFQFDRELGL